MPEAQAEGAEIVAHILERQAAEQAKRENGTQAIKHEITMLRKEMQEFEIRIKHYLTLRLGGIMVASVGLMAAVVRVC